ncbi:hypothetical protein Godav_013952 [Gossypium davidsonii]|uniref:Zinc knuckle CX2CX4HX4C domain-containing protein n=1 Tax=Gossypium davidsonii TaxID=34287 RepID=A0A7J8RJK8_GOSDV|nr:hypothetical protein [Gossypium davidsonii]
MRDSDFEASFSEHGFMGLKAILKVDKPVTRGFKLIMQGKPDLFIILKYESASKICYACGCLGHFSNARRLIEEIKRQKRYGCELHASPISSETPNPGTLPNDLFKDDDNETPEENEEENTDDEVHMSSQVGHDIDGDNQTRKLQLEPQEHVQQLHQKRKRVESRSFHIKTRKK